ncbi:MAG: hypothetical protein PHN45_08815 [Methylococcales bacterium]|nr:hypothetical protein [Methylococcales bacterium]
MAKTIHDDELDKILKIPPGATFDQLPEFHAHDVQDTTFIHKATSTRVLVDKQTAIRMDKEQLTDFIIRGRILMINSETGEPLTEYEGKPLPKLDDMIVQRLQRLQRKKDKTERAVTDTSKQ